jgi:hypothetical protein
MSIDHAIAADKLITIGGREYKLAPLTLADYGLVVRHMREIAHDPRPAARRLAATLPENEAKEVLREAVEDYKRNVVDLNAEHAIDWLFFRGGVEGNAFGIWLSMQKHHAADCPTRNELYKLLMRMSQRPAEREQLQSLGAAMAELAGVFEIKNSPAPAGETGANQAAPSTGT